MCDCDDDTETVGVTVVDELPVKVAVCESDGVTFWLDVSDVDCVWLDDCEIDRD